MPDEAQPILQERIAVARENGMADQVDGTLERWFTPQYLEKNPPEVQMIRQQVAATPLAGYLGCSEALGGTQLPGTVIRNQACNADHGGRGRSRDTGRRI